MSEFKGITKFQMANMFGELAMFGHTYQDEIDEEYTNYNYFTKEFFWNDIGCELDIQKREYPELTPNVVRELCASYILEKIGKSIEVQLC